MIDRLLHYAHVVAIRGDSYRLKDKTRVVNYQANQIRREAINSLPVGLFVSCRSREKLVDTMSVYLTNCLSSTERSTLTMKT